MGKAIGIDLGTTNTVSAVMEGPKAKILQTRSGEYSTRSVVYMSKDKEPLVGSKAFDKAGSEPECTVISPKRLIGRQFEDKEVQKARTKYQYAIEKNPEGADVVVELRGEKYTPTQIQAMILRKVKDDAKHRLGEEVTHAVITVPAYFDPIQKEQTRIAGEMAGFRVKKIISEPTAAAIAHTMDRDGDEPLTLVVYDLGGGTFDISCLFSQSGVHTELDKEGDMWLGGDNFDEAIMDYFLEEVKREHGIDPTQDKKFMFALRKAAEVAKKELGEMTTADISPTPGPKTPSGEVLDLCVPITRARFEELIRKQIEETAEKLETGMSKAGVTPEQVDKVLLVGGSTAIPFVKDVLAKRFGEDKISQSIDPMTCVAVGAAKLARDLGGIVCPNPECPEMGGYLNPLEATNCEKCGFELVPETDCPYCGAKNPLEASECGKCGAKLDIQMIQQLTPEGIGIEVEGGQYEIIMPKNSPYPSVAPYTRQFVTATAAQEAIFVPVYQGEARDDVKKNRFLGAGKVLLGEQVPENTPVDVSIRYDRDGVLLCAARVHFGNVEPYHFPVDPRIKEPTPTSGGDGEADWRSDIPFHALSAFATVVLDRFDWMIADNEVTALRGIKSRLEAADAQDDREKGKAAVDECSAWFDRNSGAQLLAAAEILANDPRVPADVRTGLGTNIGKISAAASQNRMSDAEPAVLELNQLVGAALEAINSGGGGGGADPVGQMTKLRVAGS